MSKSITKKSTGKTATKKVTAKKIGSGKKTEAEKTATKKVTAKKIGSSKKTEAEKTVEKTSASPIVKKVMKRKPQTKKITTEKTTAKKTKETKTSAVKTSADRRKIIVYIASEASPFVTTGGLGEVVGSLPPTVAKDGYRVIVILPLYQKISEHGYPLERKFDLMHLQLSMKEHIFSAFGLQKNDVEYYFIEYHEYFHRPGIYEWQGESYADNPLRFGFFSYAAIELLRRLRVAPLAVHLHDWPTALVPVIAHANYQFEPLFKNTRYVLTIHNLAYQGTFSREWLERLHLPYDYFYAGDLEYHGKINFLKGGIAHSSAFNTVSPAYAHEILFADKGEYLENFIREQSFKLSGILNGIDLQSYNPATDKALEKNFSTVAQKKVFQKLYLNSQGIYQTGAVFAFVSRLTFQKGVDTILESMGEILLQYPDATFLAIGSGENQFETGFHYLQLHFPDRVRYIKDFDPKIARNIYAASDIYLMPSRFEPCGLGQMIAARYGALPLVNPTGGLRDTVLPFNEFSSSKEKFKAIGFTMGNFSAYDVRETIHYAMRIYRSKAFEKAQKYNMGIDFSWERSASHYEKLYKGI